MIMRTWWNKNTVLTLLLALVALAIVVRITPPYVPKVVELTLVKNKGAIRRIDQEREVDFQRTLWVDRLDLSRKNQLRHTKLGQIGYADNFFVDIDHTFEVLVPGEYRFLIGSDDGFIAKVDGREICRFNRDRGYRKQSCRTRLDEGEHRFELTYFQGGGHAGLTVEYRLKDGTQAYFFGEDSQLMRF
ncbi:PA14 domain-containing protein [Marinimicrobium sp. LS-A18]|uniref:PA14 domain-containing protein n=1 Tax=Marinimicrobium sp. LS-A18 TaxID=1381596 RepID=UPI0004644863|nr:PA14 domain-containing protein [Marinimicrobium sp. LS-A18]